jgi:hypothetical protein
MGSESRESLTPAVVDYVLAGANSVLGAVPFAGSLLVELAGAVIPNQRLDRIARFAALLDERLSVIEDTVVRQQLTDESFTDLAEEALRQAARATTDGRLRHIANVLANSIECDDLSAIEAKHLLDLLGELNDIEVIRLGNYAESAHRAMGEVTEYYKTHQAVLLPVNAVSTVHRKNLIRKHCSAATTNILRALIFCNGSMKPTEKVGWS